MDAPANPRRRFRFGLRTLLAVVAAFALAGFAMMTIGELPGYSHSRLIVWLIGLALPVVIGWALRGKKGAFIGLLIGMPFSVAVDAAWTAGLIPIWLGIYREGISA